MVHPHYLAHPFYVAGDFYAGKIVPIVAQLISKGKKFLYV
jgi:serine carboxypeptidase-like clade I